MSKTTTRLGSGYFFQHQFILGSGFESNLMDHLSTELILMISGEGDLVVGEHTFRMSSEMLMLVNAGEPRFFYPASDDTLLLICRDARHHLLTDAEVTFQKYHFERPKNIIKEINLVSAIGKLYLGEQEEQGDKIQIYLSIIKNHLASYQMPNRYSDETAVIFEIMDYMCTHYKEDISLSHLSDAFNFSTSYLSRIFKKITGMGLQEFLQRVRILYAREALIDSDENIAMVAEECGFNSARNMNRLFLRYTEWTPSDTRKTFKIHVHHRGASSFESLPAMMAFKDWLNTLVLSKDDAMFIRSYRNVLHEVDGTQSGASGGDMWTRVGNFSMSGYDFFTGDKEIFERLFQELEYKKLLFSFAIDEEGEVFLRAGRARFVKLNRNMLMQLLNLIKKYKITPIISFDIFTLSSIELGRANYKELLAHSVSRVNQYLRQVINFVGVNTFLSWYFDFALPNFLDFFDEQELFEDLNQFLLLERERFLRETGAEDFKHGIYIGQLGIKDISKMNRLVESGTKVYGLLPRYVSFDLIEFEVEQQPFVSLSQKIQKYGAEIKRFIQKYMEHPMFSQVEIFVTNVCVPYSIPDIPEEYLPAFMNSVAIEILRSVSYYVSSINSATVCAQVNGEDKYIDITPLSEEGFKTPIYHSLRHLRHFQGNPIYFKEGCYVQKEGEDYHVILYADLDESILASYQNYDIEVPIEVVEVCLKGLVGRYKVTAHRLNLEHGCVSMIKKNFYGGGNQYLDEEYDYIDRISIPQMEAYIVDLNGTFEISEKLKLYGVSFFHIQKILAITSDAMNKN